MGRRQSENQLDCDNQLSVSVSRGCIAGRCRQRLNPRNDVMAEQRNANETRSPSQFSMAEYGQSSFSPSKSARRLNAVAHTGLTPPVVENTNRTKPAQSTSHSLLILISLAAFMTWLISGTCMAGGTFGWKTLTLKSDRLKRSPQNPQALTFRRASWVVFTE